MTPRKSLKDNRILKTIIVAYHKHIHLIHDYGVLDTVLNKHWKAVHSFLQGFGEMFFELMKFFLYHSLYDQLFNAEETQKWQIII